MITPPWEKISQTLALVAALCAVSLISIIASGNTLREEAARDREAMETLALRVMVLQNKVRYYRKPFVGPPEDAGGFREFEEMKRRHFLRYGPETLPPPRLIWEK